MVLSSIYQNDDGPVEDSDHQLDYDESNAIQDISSRTLHVQLCIGREGEGYD